MLHNVPTIWTSFRIMLSAGAFACIAGILFVVASTVSLSQEQTKEGAAIPELVHNDPLSFSRMVFGSTNTALGMDRVARPCLQKWKDDVDYTIVGNASDSQVDIINQAIQRIGSVTGLSFLPQTGVETESRKGSVRIVLTDVTDWNEKNFKRMCSATRNVNAQCVISASAIFIPGSLDEPAFRYCVIHELLHAVGIQGHAWKKQSILNPDLDEMEMTEWDVQSLQTLYRKDLAPGFTIRKTVNTIKSGGS